ncbi:hypothetical protein [Pseudoduganella lurida]|nr:hypothetical protein [Pseudoduganella lurida]
MQSDSSNPGLPGPAGEAASADRSTARISRRVAYLLAALALVAIGAGGVWTVQTVEHDRALAAVERSVAAAPAPAAAPQPVAEAPVPGPVPATADRLPPLPLPGQAVPAAVLRDLPPWLAAELAPVETSGGSGDESALPPARVPGAVVRPHDRGSNESRESREVSRAREGYSAVFARCPRPGESGAVECRRAVCDGAARKASACAPYKD